MGIENNQLAEKINELNKNIEILKNETIKN
jgi:hypothetical protein